MVGGQLVINGAKGPQRRVEDFSGYCPAGYCELVHQFEEQLPGGMTVRILDLDPHGPLDDSGVFEVPADSYFVLGDNRDNSNDSREGIGFVPRSAILGKAAYKYVTAGHWTWQSIN
jgi:signal peptidase I